MKTIICAASGPSLTSEDCRLIVRSQIPTMAINSTWSLIPECRWLYASDMEWWRKYHDSISSPAQRWTSHPVAAKKFGLRHFVNPLKGSFNSGQRAILLASALGARRILLVGYDCSIRHGTHWHGDHPYGLGNPSAVSISAWKDEFQRLRAFLPDTDIINCSRYTELDVFPRGDLLQELETIHGEENQPAAESASPATTISVS